MEVQEENIFRKKWGKFFHFPVRQKKIQACLMTLFAMTHSINYDQWENRALVNPHTLADSGAQPEESPAALWPPGLLPVAQHFAASIHHITIPKYTPPGQQGKLLQSNKRAENEHNILLWDV